MFQVWPRNKPSERAIESKRSLRPIKARMSRSQIKTMFIFSIPRVLFTLNLLNKVEEWTNQHCYLTCWWCSKETFPMFAEQLVSSPRQYSSAWYLLKKRIAKLDNPPKLIFLILKHYEEHCGRQVPEILWMVAGWSKKVYRSPNSWHSRVGKPTNWKVKPVLSTVAYTLLFNRWVLFSFEIVFYRKVVDTIVLSYINISGNGLV